MINPLHIKTHEEIVDDSENFVFHSRRLIQHLLDIHKGSEAEKEATLALVFEHLNERHNAGLADAESIARRISDAKPESKVGRIIADAIERLRRENIASHKSFTS